MDSDDRSTNGSGAEGSATEPGTAGDDRRKDDGLVDRRKFVAGVSALGVGGVAGCLGDGGDGGSPTGSPTATGTATDTTTPPETPPDGTDTATPTEAPPDETDTATPTETPGGEPGAFAPIVRNLVYQYFEGGFSELPDFDQLAPTSGGELDDGLVSLDPAEREENFALAFEAELDVGGRLRPGVYTFAAEASDAAKVYVAGAELLDATDGRAEQSVQLQDRTYTLRVEYFQTTGPSRLAIGWRGTYDELLPRIAEADPYRSDLGMPMVYQGSTDPSLEMDVGTRPQVKRIQMPGSSARSLAVGMPDLTNYCFDPTTAGVKYAWRGAFINYGPIIAFGGGRGDDPARLLGTQFPIGGMDYPLRIGDPDATPSIEFMGCREHPHPPELWYSVDGHEVTHAVEGVPGGLGVVHTVAFGETPSDPVYFHTADDDVAREATAGEWNGTTLTVPAGVEEFSVTITTEGVGG